MGGVNVDVWVRRAQQGDADAVRTLYEQFAEGIYRYIFYRVADQHDAEDLTTEVFVRMVEGLPRYRFTGAPFEAWLYRIASARVIDLRRRQRRRIDAELHEDVTDSGAHPEDDIQQEQEIATLRTALHQLTDDEQTVLILRFVENKSHQEAAAIMGKSPAAVKAMQHRALTRLAALLGSDEKVRHYLRGGRS